MSGYRIGIDPLSPASSDYEDQESETDSQHIATVHKVIFIKLYNYMASKHDPFCCFFKFIFTYTTLFLIFSQLKIVKVFPI